MRESVDGVPWHHLVYDDIDHWDNEKLISVYRRLSRDMRFSGRTDEEHISRMMAVESEMNERDIDPHEIALEVQGERDEIFD